MTSNRDECWTRDYRGEENIAYDSAGLSLAGAFASCHRDRRASEISCRWKRERNPATRVLPHCASSPEKVLCDLAEEAIGGTKFPSRNSHLTQQLSGIF